MAPIVLGLGAVPSSSPLVLEDSAVVGLSWRNPPLTGNLPSGIQPGDLLLAFLAADDDPDGGTSRTYSLSGWEQLYHVNMSGQGNGRSRAVLWARVATGSEGSTISVTGVSGSGAEFVISTLRISGWDDSLPLSEAVEVSSTAQGFSQAPNPPSLSPSWGASSQSLYIAATQGSGGWFESTIPGGFDRRINAVSNNTGDGGGNQWNAMQILAFKNAQSASEDPGAFGTYSNFAWAAHTIAIKGKGSL